MYSVQITVKKASHLSATRDMNYIIKKLNIQSLALHTYSKPDFMLKMHFGIYLGLVTDAAVGRRKCSAVRLAPDTLKKSVLKQLFFQEQVMGLLQSLLNKFDGDH